VLCSRDDGQGRGFLDSYLITQLKAGRRFPKSECDYSRIWVTPTLHVGAPEAQEVLGLNIGTFFENAPNHLLLLRNPDV